MKISELIELLGTIQGEHGDIPVLFWNDGLIYREGEVVVNSVSRWPDTSEKAAVIGCK